MITIKETILKYSGIINEDTPTAYANGLFYRCFKNGITVSKTGKEFNDERLKINNNYLEDTNPNDFANKVIIAFRNRHPEFFDNNQIQSFEGIIRDLAIDYFNRKSN